MVFHAPIWQPVGNGFLSYLFGKLLVTVFHFHQIFLYFHQILDQVSFELRAADAKQDVRSLPVGNLNLPTIHHERPAWASYFQEEIYNLQCIGIRYCSLAQCSLWTPTDISRHCSLTTENSASLTTNLSSSSSSSSSLSIVTNIIIIINRHRHHHLWLSITLFIMNKTLSSAM